MKTTAIVEMNNLRNNRAEARQALQSPTVVTRISRSFARMAQQLALVFSFILGERVSAAYSLCLLNVMVSGLCAFLFGGASLTVQLLLLVWLGVAVWQAKMVK